MKNVIIAVVVGIIAGVGGYFVGSSGEANIADAKKLQDSVTMMNEQATAIRQMSEMMRSAGTMMQTMGTQYKNEEVVSTGKDLTAVATKYLKEAETKATGSDSMKEMMN